MGVREVKDKAAKLMAQGQFLRAEVLLRQVLTQVPRDAATWLKHAEVLKKLGRPADAVASYRLAARILDDEGHHPRAVAALKLALSLLPDDVDLITDIIRSEMRARRGGETVRSMFPLSSPSQLLSKAAVAPAPSAIARDADGVQLSLPGAPQAGNEPAPLASSSDAQAPGAAESNPAEALTPSPAPVPATVPQELALPPSADGPARTGESSASAPVEETAPTEPEVGTAGPEAADDVPGPGAPPTTDPAGLAVEVVASEHPWPQVRRLSARAVAIRASPDARWVVISGDLLEVRFVDELEVPDEAEWFE